MLKKTMKMMQEQQRTIKMNESNVQKTIQMGNNGAHVVPSYIDVGSVLNGKYRLTKMLTRNTGEAALYICEANKKKYVAKVFLHSCEPKMEVIETLKTINHPNVIKLIDEGWQNERYYEIMPYYSKGDLINALPLSEEYILKKVVPSVNEALRVIHEKHIVHRDIKPNNIFVADDGTIVVGDFGISSVLKEGQQYRQTGQQFTINYSPPESFAYNRSYISPKFDYYTFGQTLIHLATGKIPYDGLSFEEIVAAIINEPVTIPSTVKNQRLRTLILGLTVKDVNYRWGYEEVSRFLNGENVELRMDELKVLKPYVINGKTARTAKELAVILTTEWEEGKKHLERRLLRKFTEQIDNDILSKTIDCEQERNKDVGLFKMILFLNGGEFFSWKGKRYFDLYSFGQELNIQLPEIDRRGWEMLSTGALQYFVNKYVKSNDAFMKKFNSLTKANSITKEVYYKFCFMIDNKKQFKFENETFSKPDELIAFITRNKDRIHIYSSKLYDNEYFFAWLESIGYREHIHRWRSFYNK